MVNGRVVFNLFQLLIGVQDEDSCGKSGIGETPQERKHEEAHRPPAESEVLHGNQQRVIADSHSCLIVRLYKEGI